MEIAAFTLKGQPLVDFPRLVMEADTRGMQKGEIALERVAQAAERVDKRVRDASGRFVKAGSAANQVAAGFKNSAGAADELAKASQKAKDAMGPLAGRTTKASKSFKDLFSTLGNSHRFRMTAVQLGQVSQQMIAGTSAARALSIQAADLLLPFGTMGAVLGVASGAFVPLIESILGAGDESEKSKDHIEDLAEAVDRLAGVSQASGADIQKYLGDTFGVLSRDVQALIDDLRAAEFGVISNKIRREFELVTGDLTRLSGAFEVFWEDFTNPGSIDPGYLAQIQQIIKQAGIAYPEFVRLDEAMEAVFAARSTEDLVSGLANARTIASDIGGPIGKQVSKALLDAAKESGVLNRVLASAAGEVDSTTEALRDAELAARNLASALQSAAGFSAGLEDGVRVLEAEIKALEGGADAAIASQIELKRIRAENVRDAAIAAGEDRIAAEARYALDLDAIEATGVLTARKKALAEVNRKTGNAARSGATSTIAALRREISQRQMLLNVTGRERQHLQAVYDVQRRLGKDASKLTKSQINGLADQVVELENTEAAMRNVLGLQEQWSQQITRTAFEGGNLRDVVKGMLRDIALQFASARIVLPVVASVTSILGLGGIVAGGAALQGASTAVGLANLTSGGGLLGTAAANVGGFLGGVGQGIGGVLSGGGTGSSFANLGGLLSGSVGGAGAIGAAIPALGVIAGAGLFLKNAFSREFEGTSLRGRVTGSGVNARYVDHYGGGLFRSDARKRRPIEASFQRALDDAILGRVATIREGADALGLSTNGLSGFRGRKFRIWTKNKSPEEIQRRIDRRILNTADDMARLVLGTNRFSRSGERAYDTLRRLSTHLTSVNDLFEAMGKMPFMASLTGAGMASDLVRRFGGLDQLNTSVTGYYEEFYSQEERRAHTLKSLNMQMAALGVAMPRSRAQFRELVESIDLSSASGRQLYTDLIGLSDAMAFAFPEFLNQFRTFLDEILNTNLTPASGSQVLAANRSRFNMAVDLAAAGDSAAAQQVTGYARTYLNSLRANARSEEEYRRSAARVLAQISGLADMADLANGVIPQFAMGGFHTGGGRIVGENGPEYEVTGPARYYSAAQTRSMMNGGSSQELREELAALRAEIAAFRSEQRQLGLSQNHYSKKQAQITNKWDRIGLPAEQT